MRMISFVRNTNHHCQILIKDNPASAGNTQKSSKSLKTAEAHPRLCGGIRLHISYTTEIRGLTPACAGNTRSCNRSRMSGRAHPRLCGEYYAFSLHVAEQPGSPPPVRGIPDRYDEVVVSSRLTPSCAGNTKSRLDDLYAD